MTRYTDFDKLRELTKLTTTDRGYAKFIQTGQLGIFDYNTGFIDLQIYAFDSSSYGPSVRLWFGTVDDGDYGAWRPCKSMRQAQEIAHKVAHEVFKDMVSFPKEAQLNKMLEPYGIHACRE